jgi:hypothetical protein
MQTWWLTALGFAARLCTSFSFVPQDCARADDRQPTGHPVQRRQRDLGRHHPGAQAARPEIGGWALSHRGTALYPGGICGRLHRPVQLPATGAEILAHRRDGGDFPAHVRATHLGPTALDDLRLRLGEPAGPDLQCSGSRAELGHPGPRGPRLPRGVQAKAASRISRRGGIQALLNPPRVETQITVWPLPGSSTTCIFQPQLAVPEATWTAARIVSGAL